MLRSSTFVVAIAETATDLWYWNLNGMCKTGPSYSVVQDGRPGTTFSFNICGLSSDTCNPLNNDTYVPKTGVAVQFSDGICALAGEGAPIFTPMDLSNPATGGISLLHHAAPIQFIDSRRCAAVNGIEVNRRVQFNISCDPNVPTLVTKPAIENPECNYIIPIASKFGCGKIYDGPDSQAAANKEAGERGAEAGAVIGFMILGAVLFVGGWAGTHYFRHRELPFSIPGVGNLASGPAPAGSGFSGTTGSGFGSSAATGGGYTSTA